MKLKEKQLTNEYGTQYGIEVEVVLEENETYADAIEMLKEEYDIDDAYLANGGNSVWDQFNWSIVDASAA